MSISKPSACSKSLCPILGRRAIYFSVGRGRDHFAFISIKLHEILLILTEKVDISSALIVK